MLFEDRLMLNSAVFLNDNTNLQKTVIGQDRVRRSINTGKSKSIGFEVDANFAATDSLFFTASFGYIDTDYSEDDISDTSNYSASLAMSWTIAELEFGDLTLHTDYVLVDEFQYNLTDPSLIGDSYELLNARLTLSDIQVGDRSSLKVSLWGKNIADEDYVVHGANFGMYNAQTYGAPATYGVDVSFEF
ncbi:hypothetical protein BPTFM16_02776 [Altererythrobacter insulae]|nr:hypothetical protein BPTFM16_02776 [Altererythrobacter insulae]